MLVTAGGGTSTLTVSRAQLGTTAATHASLAEAKYITGTPDVSIDGVYIMAGGGFFVCGAARLNAPHVLIVNTADINPVTGAPYPGGALNQIQFDTRGDDDPANDPDAFWEGRPAASTRASRSISRSTTR